MDEKQAALWREADAILDTVLDLLPAERAARLATLPEALRHRVERLLEASTGPGPLDNAPALHAMQAATPLRIGAWTLGEIIGRGGMSVVHAAWRDVSGQRQQAALKLLTVAALASDGKQRFLREHHALARLAHPRIAALLDAGVLPDGTPYLAMQRIEGERIDHWCQSRTLAPRAVVELFLQVCETVAHANRHLVVHRDLKPGNILVDAQGEVRLLDFGIARLLDEAIENEATATGPRALTPQFAAPECYTGADTGTAVDVYGLGAVLYRLLSGQPPHDGGRSRDADIRPPSRVASAPGLARVLRGDLDAIAMRALESDPSRRYPDATALADDLRRWLQSRPVRAAAAGRWYRLRRFVRRHRGAVAAALLLAAAVAAGLGSTWWQSRKVAAEAARAEQVKTFLVSLLQSASPEGPDGRMEDTGDVLARGAHQAIARLDDEPALQTELLLLIARLQAELGRFDAALATLDAAEARLPHSPRNLQTRRTETALIRAQAHSGMGKLQEMREELTQAMALTPEREGNAGKRMAAYLRLRLAYARSQLGEHEQARALLEGADAMIATLRPADPHIQGEAAFYRGQWAMSRGDNAAAWDWFERARGLYRASGRLDDAADASLLTAMATLASRMDRHEEAIALGHEVLDITRRLYPPDHPLLAGKLAALATSLRDAGRDIEAESLSLQALDIRRRTLPADSVRLASSIYNHALLLLDRGQPAQALPLFAEAQRIAAAGYGENDFRTLLAASARLHALHDSGDIPGTRALAADIAALLAPASAKASFPAPAHAALLARLADIQLELGHASDALSLLDRPLPWRTSDDALRLRILLALGRHDEAKTQAGRLRARLHESAHGTIDPDTVIAFTTLGQHALDSGHADQARSDLAAAHAALGGQPARAHTARRMLALEQALPAITDGPQKR